MCDANISLFTTTLAKHVVKMLKFRTYLKILCLY